MINVSSEFKKLMSVRTDFRENAEITLTDGTVLTFTEKEFSISNNSVVDSSETNGIPLGVALCRNIVIELMNDEEQLSSYDFFGAKIRLFLTYQLSQTIEKIEYGTFTVLAPETYGETVIITALDDMYKADRDYTTGLPYPASLKAILVDACNTLDISLGTSSFLNDGFIVNDMPTDITFRQLFGYIAMIAGGNARIDTTGRLRILTYDFSVLDSIRNRIDGGNFYPWSNPVQLDGGDFSYNLGDVADGGTFTEQQNYHILHNWKSGFKVDTDDIVITGISTTYTNEDNEELSAMYGVEGYVLKVENPLFAGQEKYAVTLIGNVMVGGTFRQFSGDLVANPTCEFMDPVAIADRKGNVYASFITDINFQFFGFTSLKNSAEPAIRNSSKAYSDATATLVTARKLIKNERTAREKAVEQLAQDLKNSSGLFMTQEKQSDGSTIYYMHDKPTLEESMIVWKLTALAFGISTDGGKTYPYGFTVDGTTITRLLYAEGIDADYIDTGAIRINDSSGNTVFLADYDTKKVYINADNVFIGSESVSSSKEKLTSSIEANAESITAEVSRAIGQEVELAAAISVSAEQIALKVSKGDVSSQLSVESGRIHITSDRFSWESTNSSLDYNGHLTLNSAEIGGATINDSAIYTELWAIRKDGSAWFGDIKAEGGTIGGATINDQCIYTENWALRKDGSVWFNNATIEGYTTTSELEATNAEIENLKVDKLSASEFNADTISAMNIKVRSADVSGDFRANRIIAGTVNGKSVSWQEIRYLSQLAVYYDSATINGEYKSFVQRVDMASRKMYVMAYDESDEEV